ncbi:MAG: NAD(+)/NADH kinase [Pseudobacteriovorax sp.]|nr:NAD(+)/NADH kinase [Pseudobacteriovorax sp.]
MTVLVIRKPTNLEQHGEVVRSQVKAGGLSDSHYAQLEKAHQEHYASLEAVRDQLRSHDLSFVELKRGDMRPSGAFQAIVSVGGDGTLLSASHSVEGNTPIIGIRSSNSSVGFLCAGGIDEVPQIFDKFAKGKLDFQERTRIKAKIFKAEDRSGITTFPVLNDFLYTSANPASTTRYKAFYEGRVEVQKSSGIWVSTATGSTAAISAAGGCDMDPSDNRLQFVVRELYQTDQSEPTIQKGTFDGTETILEIENHCANGILALDGERGVIRLRYGDRVAFHRGPGINVAVL